MEIENLRFSDTEGLRIAVQVEKRGERMYRTAIRLASDPEVKDMLRQLAEEEAEHARQFGALFDTLAEQTEENPHLYSEEISAYLSAIAAAVVFPGGVMAQMQEKRLETVRDVLLAAISAEKDSILFYLELALRTSDCKSMATFFLIVEEEKKHLLSLQRRLENT